jgi:outer membrane lipoprotein-sorting protein
MTTSIAGFRMSSSLDRLGRGLLSLAAVALLAATPAAPATSSPTVDDIIARYISVRGGVKKIRSIQSLRQTGQATTGAGRHGLVTRELKRPGKVRFEFKVQGVTAVFASDGRRGWKVSPFDGTMDVQPLPDEVIGDAVEQADIEGPLVDYKAKGHKAELVGHENVGDRDTYKIKLTLKSGVVRHEYIDVKTLHLLRTDTTRQTAKGPIEIQTTFGDYKKTSGLLFPHRVEVQAVGRPQRLSVVVDTIEVNPPLSDARFEMPAPPRP